MVLSKFESYLCTFFLRAELFIGEEDLAWLEAGAKRPWALFSSKFFGKMNTVAFSFLFDKYCLIINWLGSKDSSLKLQVNCVISFYFYLYLMLNACV